MLKIEHRDVLFLQSDTPRDKKEREHIAGLNLCKEMISKYFGADNPEFMLNDYGKPYVDVEGIYFNISHSKGRVVCAVSDSPVGIDIEKLTEKNDTDIKNFAKRYFVENEIAQLERDGYSMLSFYKIWTSKEAYSKMLGSALSKNLKIDTTTLDIETYVEGEYILSVAVNKI
ncbi:MAG: 4'-phosphopantetheinyl transferase superfamily protein [Clostridia bacterium]|nr:4'-phosphopantetheinyl transferase superfamily protein [Clostridia bacterium]